jgi:hypothetical protein
MNQVRNMADGMQLRMAVAQLRGFRSHVRTPITQVIVDEYQWIIKALEEATGEYLQQFSIPHGSMKIGLSTSQNQTCTRIHATGASVYS